MGLKLITDPKSISLKIVSSPVEVFTNANREFIVDLSELMVKKEAVGIAAIQVGVPLRIFVYRDRKGIIHSVCNPVIIDKKKIKTSHGEGCLSIPNKRINKKRYNVITVKYMTAEGEEVQTVLRNQEAMIFQHELDHLNGKLMID